MTHTQRKRKTIEFYTKLDWTKPDAQLAKDVGKSRAIISFMRHRLGYPPSKRRAILSEQRATSLGHGGGLATSKTKQHMAAIRRSGGPAVSAHRKHIAALG